MRKQNSEYNNQGCSKFNFLSYTAMHLRRDLRYHRIFSTPLAYRSSCLALSSRVLWFCDSPGDVGVSVMVGGGGGDDCPLCQSAFRGTTGCDGPSVAEGAHPEVPCSTVGVVIGHSPEGFPAYSLINPRPNLATDGYILNSHH